MGHHRSRHSSRSSQPVQLIREATDAVYYTVVDAVYTKETKSKSSHSSSSSKKKKKVYSSDALKYHIQGAEGQVWTNLSSWTNGKVDAIDFGPKREEKTRGKHRSHRSHHHHHHSDHSRHHRHSHHHRHHHRHRHHHDHHHYHHYYHAGDGIDNHVEGRVDDCVDDRSDSRAGRGKLDDDISSYFERALSISTPRAPQPPEFSVSPPGTPSSYPNTYPDELPPPYSQLSSRPGSVVVGDAELPYHRQEKHGAYPDEKWVSEYYTTAEDPGLYDMECRRKLPVFYVPDEKGLGERGGKKGADTPYLIPEASAGTNLQQCPYLRQIHGSH